MNLYYLDIYDIFQIHEDVIQDAGGGQGVRDKAGIESAIVAPKSVYFGLELYPTIAGKAAVLCYELITQHPFIDGNKRVGHSAMLHFLRINDHVLGGDDDEHEEIILNLADGKLTIEEFTKWVEIQIIPLNI